MKPKSQTPRDLSNGGNGRWQLYLAGFTQEEIAEHQTANHESHKLTQNGVSDVL
jgi:hypothetical protein